MVRLLKPLQRNPLTMVRCTSGLYSPGPEGFCRYAESKVLTDIFFAPLCIPRKELSIGLQSQDSLSQGPYVAGRIGRSKLLGLNDFTQLRYAPAKDR